VKPLRDGSSPRLVFHTSKVDEAMEVIVDTVAIAVVDYIHRDALKLGGIKHIRHVEMRHSYGRAVSCPPQVNEVLELDLVRVHAGVLKVV
jgi:predicted metal-binding protein